MQLGALITEAIPAAGWDPGSSRIKRACDLSPGVFSRWESRRVALCIWLSEVRSPPRAGESRPQRERIASIGNHESAFWVLQMCFQPLSRPDDRRGRPRPPPDPVPKTHWPSWRSWSGVPIDMPQPAG